MPVRTIAFRLGALVVMVAAPLLVLAVGLLSWSAALSRLTVDRALREASRLLAIAVEQEIATSAAALYALAAMPRLECRPTPGFYEQAKAVATRYGGWVVLADAEGRQRMNTLRPLGDALPGDLAKPLAPDSASSERPFVSDVVISQLVGRPVLYVAAPLARPGEPPCWLSMGFGLERFSSLVRPPGSRSSWSGILTDARDLLIIPSSGEQGLPGSPAPEWYVAATKGKERGHVNGEWFDQGLVRIAFQRVNNGRWTVGVAAPRREYYSAWGAPVALGAIGSLLMICAAVAVAGEYARRMKREVDRLVARAASLGEGSPPPAPGSSVAELATLEKVLARADGDIRERRSEHEKRMASEALQVAAESASRSKDLFLATLSHEMRGPLTAVIGWLDVARDSLEDRKTLRRALDTASRNARQQVRIIEDLLDMSRIMSGKFSVDRHPMDLGHLVREAVEEGRLAAAEKAVELRCSVQAPALVLGDRQRLHQALGNLIANAIKFNRPGGWVEVTLERDGRNLRLAVADNGAGIPRDALPHIFERFWQAPAGKRGHGGLGLGLPLVRYIVDLHQGHVEAESAGLGRGARLVVELPELAPSRALAVPTDHALPTEASDSRLAGLEVLAVDEDDDTLGWLQTALALQGAVTWSACSAEEALKLLQQVRPDLLISELALPGNDGYALIREVRRRAGADVGALALSGQATQEARERALAEGYDAFMAKPCDTNALLATLAGLAEKHSRLGQAQ